MNDINNIDKIIREKMGGINEMPPSHLWANISAEIKPKAAAIPFYQQAYFKISLLVASIAIILGISWYIPQNPTYNNISTNIENIQKTKNEVINTPANNINNNKPENTEVITSNIEDAKENLEKEVIVENPITEPKEVKHANVDKSTYAQQQNTAKAIPTAIATNKSTQNSTSQKATLSRELPIENVEKSIAVTNNNKELQNNSSENNLENSNEEIAAIAIASTNIEEVKATPENNEEIIQEPTNLEEKISKENQEPIQAVVEETEEAVSEIKEEESTENPSETPILEDKEETPDEGMPKSNFNPKSIVYDQYSIGAHYGYEQINTGDLKVASNNFDLSFNFQNVNFIAQTGIGFQISKDRNSYTQHYKRNEYLATQVRFDSIVFVEDGNGGINPVPVNPYYTDVYDSINHTYNDETLETYYSIRVPLFIGYKKKLKYFDIFAQGGIIYSHIFRNKTGEMNQLDSESRMLESEYLINERQNNQLQYVVAGGLSYGITKRLYLNAELMTKYYHYSLYKNTESNTNTWSYEARFGVTYLLN